MFDELIAYLEDTYKLSLEDLSKSDVERAELKGKLEMIEEIREIQERGFPNADTK